MVVFFSKFLEIEGCATVTDVVGSAYLLFAFMNSAKSSIVYLFSLSF